MSDPGIDFVYEVKLRKNNLIDEKDEMLAELKKACEEEHLFD